MDIVKALKGGWRKLVVCAVMIVCLLAGLITQPMIITPPIFPVIPPTGQSTTTIRPTGDTYITWPNPNSGTHYDDVDETGAPTDTDYISTSGTDTNYYTDRFIATDVSLDGYTITNVKICIQIRSTATTTGRGTGVPLIYIGSTTYEGTAYVPGSTYYCHNASWTENPNTLLPWEDSDIDAMQIGAKGKSGLKSSTYYRLRCTQIFAEITYETPPLRYTCIVDDFNAADDGWLKTGSSPYLHDIPSFVSAPWKDYLISWFTFQDTSFDPNYCYLEIEARKSSNLVNGSLRAWLSVTGTAYDLGTKDAIIDWSWLRYPTASITTSAQACSARLKMESECAGLYAVTVRRARLCLYKPYPSIARVHEPEPQQAGADVKVAWKWSDSDGLSKAFFTQNSSGSFAANQSLSLSGTLAWANFTFTLPVDANCAVEYRYYVNDTSNNWSVIKEEYLYPLLEWNAANFDLEDPSTSQVGIRHSYGRKIFQIPENKYVAFTTNGTYCNYWWCGDGATWTDKGSVTNTVSGYLIYFNVYNISSNYYVRYVRCDEGSGDDVLYRQGSLSTGTGDIAWQDEKTVVSVPTGNAFYVCSITSDTEGYPYITYCNRTGSTYYFYLSKSSSNLGAWTTAASFPRRLNSDDSTHLVSGTCYNMGVDIWSVWCYAGGYVPRCRFLHGATATLDDIQTTGARNAYNNYYFSAVANVTHAALVFNDAEADEVLFSLWQKSTETWVTNAESVTTLANLLSFPVIGWDTLNKEFYINWAYDGGEETSAWLINRNSIGTYSERARIFKAAPLYESRWTSDPNVVTPTSDNGRVAYLLNQLEEDVYCSNRAYLYSTVSTELSEEWNMITAITVDVGHTLGEVNASLNTDGVDWTHIVLWSSADVQQGIFIYGLSFDYDVVVETGDKFEIWCNTAGYWYHTYP